MHNHVVQRRRFKAAPKSGAGTENQAANREHRHFVGRASLGRVVDLD